MDKRCNVSGGLQVSFLQDLALGYSHLDNLHLATCTCVLSLTLGYSHLDNLHLATCTCIVLSLTLGYSHLDNLHSVTCTWLLALASFCHLHLDTHTWITYTRLLALGFLHMHRFVTYIWITCTRILTLGFVDAIWISSWCPKKCHLEMYRRLPPFKVGMLSLFFEAADSGHIQTWRYSPEKFEMLIAKRKADGKWYEDLDFPGDDDEAWFFMRVGDSLKRKDETMEKMGLKAAISVDDDFRAALTDQDEGILRPGALPQVSAASSAGAKGLLEALGKATWKLCFSPHKYLAEPFLVHIENINPTCIPKSPT